MSTISFIEQGLLLYRILLIEIILFFVKVQLSFLLRINARILQPLFSKAFKSYFFKIHVAINVKSLIHSLPLVKNQPPFILFERSIYISHNLYSISLSNFLKPYLSYSGIPISVASSPTCDTHCSFTSFTNKSNV